MARVLLISKPVAPPWNDSGKNLVRDVAVSLARHTPTVMVRRGDTHAFADRVVRQAVYPQPTGTEGGFAPALADQARVFAALLGDRGHELWHFFFAPNAKSCLAGGLASALRRKRTVHTVSSAPRDPKSLVDRLFADVHVVLSAHTEQRLRAAGLAVDRIARVPPAVPALQALSAEQRLSARQYFGLGQAASLIVYPGDLEFGQGAALCIDALSAMTCSHATLVMACRIKTAQARDAERKLRAHAAARGVADRLHWVGETPRIHALLGAADVVALPSEDLYAKMDYPLVLLEAMSMGRPVIVARGSAAAELADDGGALAIAPRADALAETLDDLLLNSARAETLGAQAALVARRDYSLTRMARGYEAVYDRLLRA